MTILGTEFGGVWKKRNGCALDEVISEAGRNDLHSGQPLPCLGGWRNGATCMMTKERDYPAAAHEVREV